ncbi:MAG: protein-L-isoaspartate(D-aspartate) O-methyltransferase [Chloroflexi bacterium]|nr:MAG: protein-L-isoaspartate O-methyltransferase [Phototrophicales bacterium]RMF79977.1 MAG: protein-L-isoaspartate(D-aspartate) O-methyltransferase [Chloroflexota bacterium]
MAHDDYQHQRNQMVETQLKARGIKDQRVLDAMRQVHRHEFVSAALRGVAYRDGPLPAGQGQTISQPYIVGLMSEALHLTGEEQVLEVGTGSGYQTAVLCLLAAHVYSLERNHHLADRAASVLKRLNYTNVDIHIGDGSQGLPDMAPFDAIIVTAAAPALPGPLRSQLSPDGGRMILPIGNNKKQHLEIVTRHGNRWEIEQTIPVRFVPLIGRFGFKDTTLQKNKRSSDDQDQTANV